MLTVYSFPAGFGQPSLSPFCTKVLVELTLMGVRFETKRGAPQKSPTGKLPYAELEGTGIADSGQILDVCRARGLGPDLDAHLDGSARAVAHLVRRTLEEHVYFALVYARWVDDAGWVEQRKRVAPLLPGPLRPFLLPVLRGEVRKSLRGQGLGRRPSDEIYAQGVADVEALETLAAEHQEDAPAFFFGDTVSSTDILVHAFVGAALASAHDNPLTRAAKAATRLADISERVRVRFREAGGVDA